MLPIYIHFNKHIHAVLSMVELIGTRNFSCSSAWYFCTLFWDGVMKFWEENSLWFFSVFSKLILSKIKTFIKKKSTAIHSFLPIIITNFCPKITYKTTWKVFYLHGWPYSRTTKYQIFVRSTQLRTKCILPSSDVHTELHCTVRTVSAASNNCFAQNFSYRMLVAFFLHSIRLTITLKYSKFPNKRACSLCFFSTFSNFHVTNDHFFQPMKSQN